MITLFGIFSYTTLLKREGFPSITIPIIFVNGVYPADNAASVDRVLAAPISEIALEQPNVSTVVTDSEANFFTATIQYSEKTDIEKAKRDLQQDIDANTSIPKNAKLTLAAPYFGVTGGSLEKVDATISVYSKDKSTDLRALTVEAERLAAYLNRHKGDQIEKYFVQEAYQTVTNPVTGEPVSLQRTFDRYGERKTDKTDFYQSVIINVASVKDSDAIKLDNAITSQLSDVSKQKEFDGIGTAVSASYAPAIKGQISELQRVLLEGLLAVLIVGSIVIAIRASLITVLSMVTVISVTLGCLYLFNYSLNVITLFALILGLSLIVDDTIIMVEAIDSARRRHTDRREAVREATQKIGRAMVTATLTAALSFAPLLFVGGILGSFIRAIPFTIITALLVSLAAALIFIPLFARYLLLGPKQMGEGHVKEIAAGVESRIATFISRPMEWARHSRRKEFSVGIAAVLVSLVFIGSGGYIFQKVTFNIFPPSKDSNQMGITLTYPPNTTVAEAEKIAAEADEIASGVIGKEFLEASYYGIANNQKASVYLELTPYGKRDVTAPELADRIDARFKSFSDAKVDAYPIDTGPPSAGFIIDIQASNRPAAEGLAQDMATYLKGKKLVRPSGEEATIIETSVGNSSVYHRSDNKQIISVNATFDGLDTTTLTNLAQKAVTDQYTTSRLAAYNLKPSDISFNLGQESENQDSFKALVYAFPLVLLAIYILLVVQFRSLLQPLLIFMALPFSFFGISLGLYLTDNSFSFFAMLGFFALIGLSIKNTILLTDYANQARRAGLSPVDSAIGALSERFRPLVATSLTAVFSLMPLALTSPFWEGLAVVLIFGLLSSTFLVIMVFPYYYLGGEYLRSRIKRKTFLKWLGINLLVGAAVGLLGHKLALVFPVLIAVNIVLILTLLLSRRKMLTSKA